MIERVDTLTAPPVVGKYYLVPTVRREWLGVTADWPVMGPKHEDADHLNFPYQHYHVDIRFLSDRQNPSPRHTLSYQAAHTPLSEVKEHGLTLPAPVWRRRRCRRAEHDYPLVRALASDTFQQLYRVYAGQVCRRSKAGFICPHRNFRLGSIAPVEGVITCPLHGLRIDAKTGVVLAPEAA